MLLKTIGWTVLAMTISATGMSETWTGSLAGRVVDAETGQPLAARIYVLGSDGEPHFPEEESVVRYDVTRGVREAYVWAGPVPFRVEIPAGTCTVTIERGKEYVPLTEDLAIPVGATVEREFRIRRLFDMAKRGWYSGDLHVHTSPKDLTIVQESEDLNVTFPLTGWTTASGDLPANSFGGPVPEKGKYVPIDGTHGFWNLNTEYEIFSVAGEGWTLGSIMILGHKEPFTLLCPPVTPVIEEARRQGAILDLEKVSWPWSTMLVPVAGMDVMELSNNHMWRLKPYFGLHDVKPPAWMGLKEDAAGWAEYGFQMYYAFLNCGFRIAPAAGTANGVHPAPLGHSRVFVKIDGEFSYDKWIEGLRRGRGFATNGPMLFLEVDGMLPGDERSIGGGMLLDSDGKDENDTKHKKDVAPDADDLPGARGDTGGEKPTIVNVNLEAMSAGELDRVELVVNGDVAQRFECPPGSHFARFKTRVALSGSAWIAARCFEVPPKDNARFAHTGPVYFTDPERPLKPKKQQIEYLIDTVQAQLDRGKGPLPDELIEEYRKALEAYRSRM